MKHQYLCIIGSLLFSVAVSAQDVPVYSVTVPAKQEAVIDGHLHLGGVNPAGNRIAFNSFYMTVDNRPFIPIMGEIHYLRVPHQYWEEEILKMKAGGVNLIATYAFWNLHETVEGVFNWSGDKDLRQFLSLCKKHNIYTMVRIGPFCHGEIRNGGLPDWLYGRPFEVRSNDEGYLYYVRRLYHQIALQLDGLYYKDGGTVIGIQLENELQSSGAPWAFAYAGYAKESTVANYDADITLIGVSVQERRTAYADLGAAHLAKLKQIATDEGIVTPLYTTTGWGNGAVLENEAIPVTAAYPYPFWAAPSMSDFFLFKDIQQHPDYSPVRYDGKRYPSFCAEMGVGIQITYSRRPRVSAEAAEALMLRTLGSGANGIGYYMYHGGLTPKQPAGVFFSDELMGVPKISYDFQAPIGEYGKTRDAYHHLKIIHLFIESFAHLLAPMHVTLPETNAAITAADRHTLRYSVRSDGKAGFVFLNNFQDHDERTAQQIGGLAIRLDTETVQFPPFTLARNVSAILPFNMSLNGCLLKYATAQPLSVCEINGKPYYFFFAPEGIVAEYVFDRSTVKKLQGKQSDKRDGLHIQPLTGWAGAFSVTDKSGKEAVIVTLTREQALHFHRLDNGVAITNATMMQDGQHVQLQHRATRFTITLPTARKVDFGAHKATAKKIGDFTEYTIDVPEAKIQFEAHEVSRQRHTFAMDKSMFTPNLSDIILDIDYVGDTGAAFIDGEMITDNLYYGNHWQIGLKQYADRLSEKGMYFYFKPMRQDASYLVDFDKDNIPAFENRSACKVNNISVIPEYSIGFDLKN